jgi:hypothetical protein
MRRFQLMIAVILVFGVIKPEAGCAQQDQTSLSVNYPISGRLLIVADSRLLVADTSTGNVRLLDEAEYPRPISAALLNPQADTVVYSKALDVMLLSLDEGTPPRLLLPYNASTGGLYIPFAWSATGDAILLGFASSGSDIDQIHVFDIESASITVLLSYVPEERLDFAPDYVFSSLGTVGWNPVYPEWLATTVSSFEYAEEIPTERFGTQFGILFNLTTGETLSVNDLVNDQVSSLFWSKAGDQLAVNLYEGGAILSFNPQQTPYLQIVERIDEGEERFTFLDWLGVNDLLVVSEAVYSDEDLVYTLGWVQDGQLETLQAFSISISSFAPESRRVGIGNWILTADEQERGELSCLFDETLPARLEVGARARVTFTDGTPSRLRAEPGLDGAEIAQMAEGTEFSVIGGPWCADEYRWWQLELDDGMIGWSAEGDAESYFLEPVE